MRACSRRASTASYYKVISGNPSFAAGYDRAILPMHRAVVDDLPRRTVLHGACHDRPIPVTVSHRASQNNYFAFR